LGIREPDVYGHQTYDDLLQYCQSFEQNYPVSITVNQSNHEGELIDLLHQSIDVYDGVILNAGAFTHYSYALLDAIQSIPVPVVEVHLSDITNRESFRQLSVIQPACIGSVMGLGFQSYEEGLKLLLERRDAT
jgi:3-dehydroquinate dehydratase-2